jgi:hypothetical protein
LYPGIFGSGQTTPDALIAGCAVEADSTVVTLNKRQFAGLRFPGLRMVIVEQEGSDWTTGLT